VREKNGKGRCWREGGWRRKREGEREREGERVRERKVEDIDVLNLQQLKFIILKMFKKKRNNSIVYKIRKSVYEFIRIKKMYNLKK
jgi:hypothetical protein